MNKMKKKNGVHLGFENMIVHSTSSAFKKLYFMNLKRFHFQVNNIHMSCTASNYHSF